jgi:hypothetical protein
MPTVTFEPAPVMTDGAPQPGRLVMADGALVAVLVPVDGQAAGGVAGWFVEAGFGPCGNVFTTAPGVFPTLEDVTAWVRDCLGARLGRAAEA